MVKGELKSLQIVAVVRGGDHHRCTRLLAAFIVKEERVDLDGVETWLSLHHGLCCATVMPGDPCSTPLLLRLLESTSLHRCRELLGLRWCGLIRAICRFELEPGDLIVR